MPLKVKKSGAYADTVAVKIKLSGAYQAVQGIFCKVAGAYQSVFSGWTVSPGAGLTVSTSFSGGVLTVTVTGDPAYNGTYYVPEATLATGLPVLLKNPSVASIVSSLITVNPGLWLSLESDPAEFTQQWYRGSSTFIGSGLTYTLQPADADQQIIYREVAGNNAGNVSAPDLIAQSAFGPLALFASGEKGIWIDPSDLTTMFQNTAGTTPVTADGQSVLRINDKSGNGLVFTQATAGNAPTYRTDGTYHWLDFDGNDILASTGNIDLSAVDSVTQVAGVYKATDAATKVICEFSANSGTNGSFALFASFSAGNGYTSRSRGTATSENTQTGYAAPSKAVVVSSADVSTDTNKIKINAAAIANTATDQGTGNFQNVPLYVGARLGGTLALTGRIYGLIVRGALSDDAAIASVSTWMNAKTGAY